MAKRMNMSKFNALVRSAVSSPHKSRVRIVSSGGLTGSAETNFNLLNCDDDPDYDLTSDGTNVAEVQPFSKIKNISLDCWMSPGSTGIGNRLEWILFKDPDGLLSTVSPSTLFTADQTLTTIALRKYTLAYGWLISTGNYDATRQRIRIRRAALKRAGLMHDGDVLRLRIANSSASAGNMMLTGGITTIGR